MTSGLSASVSSTRTSRQIATRSRTLRSGSPGQEGLSEFFIQYLTTLGEIIRPHIRNFAIDTDFYEDYTIYVTDRRDDTIDPVPLLLADRTRVSSQVREDIIKNSLSYSDEDLAVISWDSALLCGPESPTDLIDLIEFANVQVLELRYYDRELTREMARMYDDIEYTGPAVLVCPEPQVPCHYEPPDEDVR